MRIQTQWVWGGVSCLSYKLPGNIKAANPEYHALRARMQSWKLQEIRKGYVLEVLVEMSHCMQESFKGKAEAYCTHRDSSGIPCSMFHRRGNNNN